MSWAMWIFLWSLLTAELLILSYAIATHGSFQLLLEGLITNSGKGTTFLLDMWGWTEKSNIKY